MRYVRIEELKTVFIDEMTKVKEIQYAEKAGFDAVIREQHVKDVIKELGWPFYERFEYVGEHVVHRPSDSRQIEHFPTFMQAYQYMQTGEKHVRVSLSYQQLSLAYRSQTDADLDRDGNRPDLVIAIYCLETGREKCLQSWKKQQKAVDRDHDLQDIYD
jgi:hypothetical protein